ncbi:MAG: hypothetical protein ACYDD4_12895 [Acidimicrobiales bacterium]
MKSTPVRMLATPGREAAPRWKGAPKGSHEWVSFPDPDEERTWMFDVTFLESNWTCIFGNGCQGVLTGPAPELVHGCCSYGAHLTGGKDRRRVEKAAAALTPDQWQFWRQGRPTSGDKKLRIFRKNAGGEMTTRLVDDACIFLNRPGFSGGPGCALHRAALESGTAPLKLKPDVCWQLPLRREDEVGEDGYVTSIVRQWDRRDWGEGGFEFHWWCTEGADAFVGSRPVYEEMHDELVELVGASIYKRLVRYLRARVEALTGDEPGNAVQSVTLPHPAIRRR